MCLGAFWSTRMKRHWRGRTVAMGALVAIGAVQLAGCPMNRGGGGAVLAELEINRARWVASGIDSYEYRYRKGCFCTTDAVREVFLRIDNGVVVSGAYVDDGS